MAVTDETDIDAELILATGEFASPVQGVHQPEGGAGLGHVAGGDLLLGDHGDVRCRVAKAPDDDGLRGVISLGDRRCVAFAQDLEAPGADRQDRITGAAREAGGEGEQGLIVHMRLLGALPWRGRTGLCPAWQ